MLSKEESIQYSRQIQLKEVGNKGQELLKASKVLVVGAGGLGCPVLIHLTTCGVGNITIIDDDLVSLSNLPRQTLYDHSSIGKPKTEQAIKKLKSLNPSNSIKGINAKLNASNASEIIKNVELVIDCTDNLSARYLINDACVLHNKPFIYGGVFKHEGQIAVFNYKGSATYRCLFEKQTLETTNCENSGVMGFLPTIIGAYQANEALKVLVGYGQVLKNKLLIINSLNVQTNIIEFSRINHPRYKQLSPNNLKASITETMHCENQLSHEIDHSTFIKLLNEDIQLIDVREPNEQPKFNPPNTINIPEKLILKSIDKIERNKRVILFCNSGKRSKNALLALKSNSYFNNIMSLKNGISALEHEKIK